MNFSDQIMAAKNTENKIIFDEYLDAKGLSCPLPILKTKVLLNKMESEKMLLVEATDPHSQVDFEAYCARTRHELVYSECVDSIFRFLIKRVPNPEKI